MSHKTLQAVRQIRAFFRYVIYMRLGIFGILFSLLATSCSEDKLVAASMCARSCYTGDSEWVGVGVCKRGLWSCDESSALTCEGEVLPSDELCDGLDNDCDGLVDEKIAPQQCQTACGKGWTRCLSGGWSSCSAPQPEAELCDGKDNDCDGQTDEASDLPVSLCYTGPNGSAGIGPCMPGVTKCANGAYFCFGQTIPQPEICDGKDNDCDGQFDEEIPALTYPVDLVLIVDNSCSMGPVISNVKSATSSWSQKYINRHEVKFALVVAPHIDATIERPTLVQNLSDPVAFSTMLAKQTGTTGFHREPVLDALEMISASNNPLGLSWSTKARKIAVVFSDEMPQAYFHSTTVNFTGSNLLKAQITTHVFTHPTYQSYWGNIPKLTYGSVYDILESAAIIESSLDSIIQKAACSP